MMLPVLEGTIARRVLLNFRAAPAVVRKLVPETLEVVTRNGAAIVGVCLIRLERLRPKGGPALFAMASENMAHRVAIRHAKGEGVFIWRRETDKTVMALLGGRLFPGVHRAADFEAIESERFLVFDVRTEQGAADVTVCAEPVREWSPTPAFGTFAEVSEFFRQGDCGFSCSLDGDRLEGMQLRTLKWQMNPLKVVKVRAAFFERFPPGSVEFDSALMMRGLPHEWHVLREVPELAGGHI